jgi:hypothetical protein
MSLYLVQKINLISLILMDVSMSPVILHDEGLNNTGNVCIM